ncbi:hypothetical protein Tco_1402888 [Tanacetum coccineum]
MSELRDDTLSENKDEDAHDHIDLVFNIVGLFNIPGVTKDAGSILGMRPADALIIIQTMADHSQKWHDDTTSRNIESSSSKDGPTALVGCQFCEGPYLDKDCPLNEEVKQVEEVRYGEFGRTTPFNGSNGGKFHVGPPGYYTKIDNRPPYAERRQSLEELLAKHQEESTRISNEMEVWIKKLKENVEINTRNQDASLKTIETQIEQLTEELRSKKEKSEQAKVVTVENEGPNSPKKLKNLHEISFLSDSQEENTIDQLPTKESNPGHFTLPCTIGNFNFYAMANLGASVNVLPRNIFEFGIKKPLNECDGRHEIYGINELGETKYWFFPNNYKRKEMKGDGVSFPNFLIIRYGSCQVEDSVWSKRYSKWCNKNSHDKKPRPKDYTFKEWVKLKKGHLDISKSARKDLFRLWVIDKSTKALDPDEDPFGRCLDEYN